MFFSRGDAAPLLGVETHLVVVMCSNVYVDIFARRRLYSDWLGAVRKCDFDVEPPATPQLNAVVLPINQAMQQRHPWQRYFGSIVCPSEDHAPRQGEGLADVCLDSGLGLVQQTLQSLAWVAIPGCSGDAANKRRRPILLPGSVPRAVKNLLSRGFC